jgi:nucleotide-binding universal stress UspA family protein
MTNRPNIVAAVDLDAHAAGIVRRAADLAARCNGRLVIAHVVDHRPGYESDQLPVVPATDVEDQMVRYSRAWLRGLLHHLELPAADIVVTAGRPLDGLVELARRWKPMSMVIGRPRWGFLSPVAGLARALETIGNGCALLVVARGEVPTCGDPLEQPPKTDRISHHLMPTAAR